MNPLPEKRSGASDKRRARFGESRVTSSVVSATDGARSACANAAGDSINRKWPDEERYCSTPNCAAFHKRSMNGRKPALTARGYHPALAPPIHQARSYEIPQAHRRPMANLRGRTSHVWQRRPAKFRTPHPQRVAWRDAQTKVRACDQRLREGAPC